MPTDLTTLRSLLGARPGKSTWLGIRRATGIETLQEGPVDACLWLDDSGAIRAAEMVAAGTRPGALADLFAQAVITPASGKPERPREVFLVDAGDDALQRLLRQLNIPARLTEDTSMIDGLFASLTAHLGGFAAAYLAHDDVRPESVRRLFQAAARLWERAPWERVADSQVLRIEGLTPHPLHASLLGLAGEAFGLAVYLDEASAVGMLAEERHPDALSILYLLYHAAHEAPPGLPEEIERHGWPVASDSALPVLLSTESRRRGRLSDEAEIRLATAVLEAVLALSFESPVLRQPVGRKVHVTWPLMLVEATARRRKAPGKAKPQAGASGYLLTIELADVSPAVTRAIQVPASFTLKDLHRAIQAAMGWEDAHLYRFEIDRQGYGDPQSGDRSAAVRLDALGLKARKKFEYLYDFGDDWRHVIRVSKVLHAPVEAPTLVDGAGACPPEDCGGPRGYAQALEAVADPKHPDHAQWTEWIPEAFDPAAFDAPAAAARLKRAFRPRKKR